MNVVELLRTGLAKAKSLGGGGMAGYFDSGSHITTPLQTDTPFHRALAIVDRRDGYAWRIATIWRGATRIATAAALVGYGGWAWQAHKSSVEWLVVPVDKFGEPGEVSTAVPFVPTTAQLSERAEEVVKSAFSLSTDWRINEANYEYLKNVLYGDAVRSWSEWWKETKDSGATERVVRIVTIKPSASPNTLNVVWTEQDFHNGERMGPTRRVNGDLTLKYMHPINRAQALKNKLSIYVTAMRFAPENGR